MLSTRWNPGIFNLPETIIETLSRTRGPRGCKRHTRAIFPIENTGFPPSWKWKIHCRCWITVKPDTVRMTVKLTTKMTKFEADGRNWNLKLRIEVVKFKAEVRTAEYSQVNVYSVCHSLFHLFLDNISNNSTKMHSHSAI